jgi:hypothetical protein
VPLSSSDSAASFVKVRVEPKKSELPIVKHRVAVGRNRTSAGRPHAVKRRPMVIHTYQAMHLPSFAVALRSLLKSGMVGARHGHGSICVNQTRSHCVIQMGNAQSKTLATRHGMVCVKILVRLVATCNNNYVWSPSLRACCAERDGDTFGNIASSLAALIVTCLHFSKGHN